MFIHDAATIRNVIKAKCAVYIGYFLFVFRHQFADGVLMLIAYLGMNVTVTRGNA